MSSHALSGILSREVRSDQDLWCIAMPALIFRAMHLHVWTLLPCSCKVAAQIERMQLSFCVNEALELIVWLSLTQWHCWAQINYTTELLIYVQTKVISGHNVVILKEDDKFKATSGDLVSDCCLYSVSSSCPLKCFNAVPQSIVFKRKAGLS